MRRALIIRVTVCIALGAATSIAIAWGIAAFRPDLRGDYRLGLSRDGVYDVRVRTDAGVSSYMVGISSELRPILNSSSRVSLPWYVGVPAAGDIEGGVGTTSHGWPIRTMRHHTTWASPFSFMVDEGLLKFDVPGTQRSLALPLLPIWSNLLASTVLYGALWAAILFAPAPLRRSRRRRRGRCPRCAYDLCANFAAGCPECGWNRAPAPPARPDYSEEPAVSPEGSAADSLERAADSKE